MPTGVYERTWVPLETRYWSKVAVRGPDECWPWLAGRSKRGYGVVGSGGRGHVIYAHRAAYELAHGSIDPELTVDHLCRNKTCQNPGHLELVTRAENTRRERAFALV